MLFFDDSGRAVIFSSRAPSRNATQVTRLVLAAESACVCVCSVHLLKDYTTQRRSTHTGFRADVCCWWPDFNCSHHIAHEHHARGDSRTCEPTHALVNTQKRQHTNLLKCPPSISCGGRCTTTSHHETYSTAHTHFAH